ncbi:MAG: heme biosynthesis HemY N-terminal domain-containing protein, partial [Dokdonella sp.]|uniref:heme biosynthesis HemY N-terminal domain-containing protein n=1 Tax=Dokdonella sp. TaxID=2291710 RepID=UPI0032656FB7
MKLWRTILLVLLVAVAAALAWHWLSADPGYVQLRIRGTTIETSVVVAIAFLLLLWALVTLVWHLLRWPFRYWGRTVKRRGRERLAGGITAFAEGDYAQAERDLAKAANHAAFRTAAMLVLSRAAHE